MIRDFISIKQIGKDVAWMLLDQAAGMPDAKILDRYLEDKTMVLLFNSINIGERLCVTGAIRQSGGHIIYCGPEERWKAMFDRFPVGLSDSICYFVDAVFSCGTPLAYWDFSVQRSIPFINCGAPEANPAGVLASVGAMMRVLKKPLNPGVKVAWVGNSNGTLRSLIAAMEYFPFSLRVFCPTESQQLSLVRGASGSPSDVTFTSTLEEAIAGANFVFAGSSVGLDENLLQRCKITTDLMAKAADKVGLLIGDAPIRLVPVDEEIFRRRPMLSVMQSEIRLCIYKRVLHWIFNL